MIYAGKCPLSFFPFQGDVPVPGMNYRDPTQPLPHEVVANVDAARGARGKRKLPVAVLVAAGAIAVVIVVAALVIAFG